MSNIFKKILGSRVSPDPKHSDISETIPQTKKTASSVDESVLALGVKFIDEYVEADTGISTETPKLSELQSWAEIKSKDEIFRTKLCYAAILRDLSAEYRIRLDSGLFGLPERVEDRIPSQLMRKPLPFTETQLQAMIINCAKRRYLDYDNPIKAVLLSTQEHFKDKALTAPIKSALQKIIKKSFDGYSSTRDIRNIRAKAEAILNSVTDFKVPKGPWTIKFLNQIDDPSATEWTSLFEHAMTAKGSAPSKKWMSESKTLLKTMGTAKFQKITIQWIETTKTDPVPSNAHTDLAKGLVWIAGSLKSDDMALALGRFASYCFIKIASHGQRNQALGNACTAALANMGTPAAISELIRLRDKIKYPSTKAAIQKKLEKLAVSKNISLSDLEAKSLPDFGFDSEGKHEKTLEDFKAVIEIKPSGAAIKWFASDGAPRKTIPKKLRENFKQEIKDLKQKTKDISAVVDGQLTALEQSWLNDLSWSAADWQSLYLRHPVRTQITRSLIWQVSDNDKTMSFMANGSKLRDLNGQEIALPKDGIITLWHPVNEKADTVLKWRKIIEENKITQPIKQAHREIYVLTDAERATDIYSNRFAAHVIRQYQFKALCGARHWSYSLQGRWDSFNIPVKTLHAHEMRVEYQVEAAVEDELSEAEIYIYLATDQVRFFNEGGAQIRLADIPPIVFSEIMRDVDLFVAVTSVANDPNWTDGGPDGRFGQYWQRQAFGDLGETAKIRKTLIESLVPKLAIKDKLKVTEKYLEVQGKLNTYDIHFGSGNIMIRPDNCYLCIVRAGKSKDEGKVYLPFEGDNMLSLILSKAMLLVDDDKITDKTIISQLRR